MRKLTYLAIIEEGESSYGAYFPDLPGCGTSGDTIEEVCANAKEALELHIYGMEKDNDKLPSPSRKLKTNDEMVTPITIFPDLVKHEMENRRVKTNVTIPLWLKERAEAEGINYSRILEMALLEMLSIKKRNHKMLK
ncbi:type II toxin-antitoxin system HicB family antitoxin [Anaerorhabdus sp.]|uniref:type II toxin-antitoxin system HicB family antitoxin n=1 Tax=Anaerorhabdus sp. TaxID=1872524 RepID=UPI002FC79566